MKPFLILLTFLAVQMNLAGQMNTMQSREVVHLRPTSAGIPKEFGGKLLVLINSPGTINLPQNPPKPTGPDILWSLDVKNMGPNSSTVAGPGRFVAPVKVGQTIHIYSDGTLYRLKY